jgi:hypothetical protein
MRSKGDVTYRLAIDQYTKSGIGSGEVHEFKSEIWVWMSVKMDIILLIRTQTQ